MHPEPRRGLSADRLLGHGHVTLGGPQHALLPAAAGRPELLREDGLFELEAVAAPPERPRKDRHDRGVRLHLEERERGRRGRRAAEEGDEDRFLREHVLVHEDRDGLAAPDRSQDLARRVLLLDNAIAQKRAPVLQLFFEQRVVQRPDDRGDRPRDETGADGAQLPAAEVRREEENALAARARRGKVLLPGEADAGKDVFAGESRGLQKLHERGPEVPGAAAGDPADLGGALLRKRAGQVFAEDAGARTGEEEVEPCRAAAESGRGARRQELQGPERGAEEPVLQAVAQVRALPLSREWRFLFRRRPRCRRTGRIRQRAHRRPLAEPRGAGLMREARNEKKPGSATSTASRTVTRESLKRPASLTASFSVVRTQEAPAASAVR